MPQTRKKVYPDNETGKNIRIYKKTTEQATVANVNKPPSSIAGPSSSVAAGKKDHSKRKGVKETQPSPAQKIPKKVRDAEVPGKPIKQRKTQQSGSNVSKGKALQPVEKPVTFEEDDQIIRMEVDKGDESYCDSESESSGNGEEEDPEVSFKANTSQSSAVESEEEEEQSNSSSQSDDRSSRSSSETEESEREQPTMKRQRVEKKSTEQQMRDIDWEMQTKLLELQELMEDAGLQGSAQLIQNQLLPRVRARNSPMPMPAKNCNGNSSTSRKRNHARCQIKKDMLNTSNSEETIYEKAVPETRSNRSLGEGPIDTSDEMITVEFNNLNVTSPQIVDDRVAREVKHHNQDHQGNWTKDLS